MKCPFCKSPGFPRDSEVYINRANEHWLCPKCPSPVTYSTNDKKVAIWVLFNGSWYSIVYLPNLQKYIVQQESFDLRLNEGETKEEWAYNASIVIQLPSDETVTPTNAPEKLSLWLTFS